MTEKENELRKLVEKIADKNDETLKKLAEIEGNERLKALNNFAGVGKEENKKDEDIAKKWERELAEDSEIFPSIEALLNDLNDKFDNKKNGHE